jgi:hypothetical protein
MRAIKVFAHLGCSLGMGHEEETRETRERGETRERLVQ